MRTLILALAVAAAPSLVAQTRASSVDTARLGFAPAYLNGLRWRNVGPHRGGRAVAVVGDPTRTGVFYFGSVDGGVWRTTNAGSTWRNVSDYVSKIASVGAIAVARSEERR